MCVKISGRGGSRCRGCVALIRKPKPCGELELVYWWLDRRGGASLDDCLLVQIQIA
jgi:hypothetical protein